MSLLHYAAGIGHWSIMEPLVEDYCNHELGKDETLVIASRNGHLRIVQQLTYKNVDFNLPNGKAIFAATESGNADVLAYLLNNLRKQFGEKIYRQFKDNQSAKLLALAAGNGHDAIIDVLFHTLYQ